MSRHRSDKATGASWQHRGSGQVDFVRSVVSRPLNHFESAKLTPTEIAKGPAEVSSDCVVDQ
jgi:hypothetical protein